MSRPWRSLALVAFTACATTACSKDTHDSEPVPAPSATEPWRQVRTFATRLAAIRTSASSAADSAETPCPDDDIRAALGQGAGRLLSADLDYLSRYVERTGTAATPRDEARWDFLTTTALRELRAPIELESPRAAVDAAYRAKQLRDDYRYIAIVVAKERKLPVAEREGFHPGIFSGVLVVHELETGKKVCQASFSATSDESVAFRDPERRQEALWQDFALRIRQALNSAVGRITRHLNLDLG